MNDMKDHNKKIVAPVIVVVCISSYYFMVVFLLTKLNVPNILRIAALVFSVIIWTLPH